MRNTVVILVASIAILGASPVPADAQNWLRRVFESVRRTVAEQARRAAEEAPARCARNVALERDLATRLARIDGCMMVHTGRKDPWVVRARCYARAAREPDPATRLAQIEKCARSTTEGCSSGCGIGNRRSADRLYRCQGFDKRPAPVVGANVGRPGGAHRIL